MRPSRTSSSRAVGRPNLSAAVMVSVRVTFFPVDGSKISSQNSSVFWSPEMVSETEAIGNSAKLSSSR